VDNCYEGGMIKWVNVRRGLSYDALVKLVQDVAKVDAARKCGEEGHNSQKSPLALEVGGTT
ncbi:hypothetical protein Ddye_011177, partial [Dipteronia dyeriana]